MERVLIAIGGNALHNKQTNNYLCPEKIGAISRHLVKVIQLGFLPIITFGNGPQVGNLLDMAETSPKVPEGSITLDTCVSWTQGEIGYRICQILTDQLTEAGLDYTPMAVNTLVEVDMNDPAFRKPTKPIGKFITAEEATRLYEERGWVIGPDANRGYRRLVPSPLPKRILEADLIRNLVKNHFVVLCGGGGGIPVAFKDGKLIGIEAVIDKDYTSCLIAKTLGLENLIICTEVENVYLNFGQPDQKALHRISLEEARQYQNEGHFSAGSMGPKVAAMMDYVEDGGKRAFITSLEKMVEALEGKAGTEIYAATATLPTPA